MLMSVVPKTLTPFVDNGMGKPLGIDMLVEVAFLHATRFDGVKTFGRCLMGTGLSRSGR